MSKIKAQSLSEYMLPIALVSILGIVSLSVLGGNLNTLFTGLIGTKPPAPPAIVSKRPNFPFSPPSTNFNNPFPTLPGKNIAVDLGNGKSLSLRMADPVAAAESAGGSGVTENALAAIEQIAVQLKAQGEDPSKIAALEQLALKGQRIKDLQKQVEAKIPPEGFDSKGGRTAFIVDPANSVILDGTPITIANAYIYLQGTVDSVNLSNRHASPSPRDANFFINEYQSFYGYQTSNQPSPLKDFMNQLKQVENTGLLSNPTLNQLIKNDFSMQIYLSSTQSPYSKTKPDMGAFVKTTQTHANNICTVSRAISCQDRAS